MRATPLLVLALLSAVTSVFAAPVAFPGAEGFGAAALGARASASPTVYHVTNLNDSGTGSFRDAVSVSNRIVVFDLGGIIKIKTPVVVSANLTIAGQTAPGDGITVYGNRISFSGASNTICRYMRFRMGIDGDDGADAMGLANGNDMVFDHISASWGRDETFSINGDAAVRISIQDCLIAQGLRIHSAGGLMQTTGGVSIFRTLYADNWMRNPKIKGVNDYINNVVYNWGGGGGYIPAGDSAGDTYANMIGCYFIGGIESGADTSPFKTGNANYRLYHSGNLQDLNLDGVLNGTAVTDSSFSTLQLVGTRFAYPAPTTELTAPDALTWVLDHSGASLKRDRTDTYVLDEVRSYGTSGVFIYDEADMGGIGSVASGLKIPDADNDGMPDWWEQAAGTNPAVADATTLAADGYTNIEHYLNAIVVGGVPGATITGIGTDTGSSATDGVTNVSTLVLNGTSKPAASVAISRADLGVIATVTADASGNWTFDYSDTPLVDRTYAFFATATIGGIVTPPSQAFVVKTDTFHALMPVITSIALSPNFAISGTATPGDEITVILGGSTVGTATTDELGHWTAAYVGEPLAAGAQSFTATATDLAGNPGPLSFPPFLVNTGITPPAFTAISTDSGSSASDKITNDTTLTLSGTTPANCFVTFTRVGVGVIGAITSPYNGTFSFSYGTASFGTTLPAGVHVFTAIATAPGGAISPTSAPLTVTIDTTAPTIASIKRSNPATYSTNGGTVVFRVTFAEPVTGVDLADFTLTKSGTTGTLSSVATVSPSVYDVTVTSVSGDGTLRLDLAASGTGIVDMAGNAIASAAYTSGQAYTVRGVGSGAWISTDNGDRWNDSINWDGALIAGGGAATADFSLRDLTSDVSVTLNSPIGLKRIIFGDTDFSTPASWTIDNAGTPLNKINFGLAAAAEIVVNAATTPAGDTTDVPAANAYPQHIAASLVNPGGLTKTGVGTLELNAPNPLFTGPLTITRGIVQVGPGGTYAPSSVTIATSQQLRVNGGTFRIISNVSWTSGTGTGVIVSGGTASFQNIIPSNAANSFFKVTGGTVTAKDINFPRSGDSEAQTLGTGVLISGGDTTFANIGLGTTDSWGGMTISGGKLTVTGTLHNGYQATAARGGVIYLSGGELAVTGAADGLVMARNPGTNANNVAKLLITGGTANLAKLTLGYDSTVTDGSATVTLNPGELNLGSGGIVKNGTSGLTSTITLTSGTLGALATWSTTHPIILAGTYSDSFLRAGTAAGAPFDITLSGALSGTGGFAKTGTGTLTLAADNTYTGTTQINAGTLNLTGTIASGGAVNILDGGTLAGTGTSNSLVTLFTGGTLSPAGTLTADSVRWMSGGKIALDLGAPSDRLVVSTNFSCENAAAATYEFALKPPAEGFTLGTVYTLVTYGTTTFTASQLSYSGLGFAKGTFAVGGDSVTFTITDTGTTATPLAAWLTANGIPALPASVLLDSDGDGLPNLMEFALGGDPLSAASAGLVTPSVANLSDLDYPVVTFNRRITLGDVTTTVEVSDTVNFTTTTPGVELSATALGNGFESVVARSSVPLTTSPTQFLRVRVTLP
jgi:autotransporter-associated beta strand protein